ncbi:protein NRT1/ PTR FAMILY 4.6-like protein [Cinnamomum micranthum f. kanehirae]|uniref:Protein NRT1/ PTR FAMILY 4.6-like protein n=1 Tax=Cinnamomum micranthum f. kanehirae TaxID=337451 RepID=A0A3S4PPE8_9MAGN|nr:protein NRT1/ PTR FAMILY 4.6-like protein [Cinnamomum micranthum f. kanehirae]
MAQAPCKGISGGKAAMLFVGLYLVALGVGVIKGSLPPHGAEQFDENNPQGRKQRSTFFNYFVFCLACGALIAVTLVVCVEDNKGWQWGFGISTATILLSIPIFLAGSTTYRNKIPKGSPLTTIAKVLVAAICSICISSSSCKAVMSMLTSPSNPTTTKGNEEEEKGETSKPPSQMATNGLEFLNRAATSRPICRGLQCTIEQVEEVKIVIRILPICLHHNAQLLPGPALHLLDPTGSHHGHQGRLPKSPTSITPCLPCRLHHHPCTSLRPYHYPLRQESDQDRNWHITSTAHWHRSGTIHSCNGSCRTSRSQAQTGGDSPTFSRWPGYLSSSSLRRPQSLATSLSSASLAMGYYLSSVLVSIINRVTGSRPWLSGPNLNHYHLERFYWLMCVLSALNFIHYLLRAMRYRALQIDLTNIQRAEDVDEATDVQNEPTNPDIFALQMQRIANVRSILQPILHRGYELSTQHPSELYEAIEQVCRVLLGASLGDVQQPMPCTPTRMDTLNRRRAT